MRTYVVQPGDSPASIASRPDMAGCPKCSVDLIAANPQKPTVTLPNGFKTFRTLRAGETINLPDKWFDGTLDSRPQAYFAALAYADGVTPSTLGDYAAGVLGNFAALDAATAKVGAMASMDNQSFSNAVGDAGSAIDASIAEAYASGNPAAAQPAQATQQGTQWAWQRNQDLANALVMSGGAATSNVTQARLDIQNALATALGNAKQALYALYQPVTGPGGTSGFSPSLVSAAQTVTAAIAADPNYCASVAQSGTTVNAAVHNFKSAWNASQTPAVPINTGNYEAATAAAVQQIFGSAPVACAGGAPVSAPPATRPRAQASLPVAAATAKPGLSTGAVVGIGLLAAGAVGVVAYAATRGPRRSGARA
jgi:hypothetical protein